MGYSVPDWRLLPMATCTLIATSRSSTPWTSSPSSPSTSPTPEHISCGISGGTPTRVAACAPRPTATGRTTSSLRRRGPHRPVQPDADGPPLSSASGTSIHCDVPAAGPRGRSSLHRADKPDVIQKILAHCGLADEPPRAPPNAPLPGFRELQYVNDLEFVQDPGPAEPVWSAD